MILIALAYGTGCGKDDPDAACTIGDDGSCSNGRVCELVRDGDPACFDPVVVHGRVFDAESNAPIEGAGVLGLDASGAIVALATSTAIDGSYSLRVPAERDADGNVVGAPITLRVDASGYLAFPKAPRVALPIDLTDGSVTDGEWSVANAATDVALYALDAGVTRGTIEGTIDGPFVVGALVVADQGAPAEAVATAIVGGDGRFVLYNVPVGVATTVSAYAAGAHVAPQSVTIAASTATVTLVADSVGLATVSGGLNVVAGASFSSSSVILVVESTYSQLLAAGYSPIGLADRTITSADTSFRIEGVPPGRYVLLAAFENDGLVRDPDTSIAGTDVRSVQVSDTGVVTVTSARSEDLTSIKVTGPIAVVSPGATALEVVSTIPQLRWAKYPSTDHYEVRVFDAFGVLVYEDLDFAPGGGADPVAYDMVGSNVIPAAASVSLIDGMVYQFRVVAIKNGGSAISSTEDLLGVFRYEP